jgi:MoxR-like ATPase
MGSDVSTVLSAQERVALSLARQGMMNHLGVRLVSATRQPARHGLPELQAWLSAGASPRATIALAEGARALALMRGRRYALPEDLTDLVPEVLRHRLTLSYEALAEGHSPDSLISRLMGRVSPPPRVLQHDAPPVSSL